MLAVKSLVGTKRQQRGFSLLEVLIVVVLLAIIIPALLSAFTSSYILTRDARMLEIAKHIGQMVMDKALSDPPGEDVSESNAVVEPWSSFRYDLSFDFDEDSKRTTVTVVVRYPFLQGTREYTTVAVRYGRN